MSSRARRRTSTLLIAGIALSSVAAIVQARLLARQSPITSVTMPVISEKASPLETIAPVASDGHRGQGFLRKPPGDGPFPAVVIIHGGLATRPLNDVRQIALSAQPSRYLAAGYVISVITYRSRDDDPQSAKLLPLSLDSRGQVLPLFQERVNRGIALHTRTVCESTDGPTSTSQHGQPRPAGPRTNVQLKAGRRRRQSARAS